MLRKRKGTVLLLAIFGLLLGAGMGLWIGWGIAPVEYTDTDLSYLHPNYRDDYILMVSEAYALDGDLETARARMALLSLPDPAQALADRAEKAISQDTAPSYIRALVRLSVVMGAQRESFDPFLPSLDERP
jgi:hypothetical protein